MLPFQTKKITTIQPLGEKLTAAREAKHKTLEQLAEEISVGEKYLRALEQGRYVDIPGDVYAKIFLRKYCEAVGLEIRASLAQYDEERQFAPRRFTVLEHTPPRRERIRATLQAATRPQVYRGIAIALVILILAVIAGLQVRTFLSPPPLTITSPDGDIQTTQIELQVTGTTAPDAKAFLNGKEIPVGDDGSFATTTYLQEGRNLITITVRKKNGREATASRIVLVPTSPAP